METMKRSVKSVYIDAPVERVFPFVKDVTNWGALTPWWVAVTYEPVDITPGGTGTLSYRGKALRVIDDSSTGEIIEVIENGRVVYRDADSFPGYVHVPVRARRGRDDGDGGERAGILARRTHPRCRQVRGVDPRPA